MMTSALVTPSTGETSLIEVPRLPAASGAPCASQLARKAAGRSSIEVLGPAGAPPGRGPPNPRTTTEDGPCGRCQRSGPEPRDVVRFVVYSVVLRAARALPAAPPGVNLPAQTELLDHRAVPVDVFALQVVQQAPAAADKQQQPAAAVVVVLVHLEVLGQVADPLGQQRDLDLRRAGVTLTGRVTRNDLGLHRRIERHVAPSCCVVRALSYRALRGSESLTGFGGAAKRAVRMVSRLRAQPTWAW